MAEDIMHSLYEFRFCLNKISTQTENCYSDNFTALPEEIRNLLWNTTLNSSSIEKDIPSTTKYAESIFQILLYIIVSAIIVFLVYFCIRCRKNVKNHIRRIRKITLPQNDDHLITAEKLIIRTLTFDKENTNDDIDAFRSTSKDRPLSKTALQTDQFHLARELNSIIGNLDTNGNADSHDQANHDQAVKQTDSSLGSLTFDKEKTNDDNDTLRSTSKDRPLSKTALQTDQFHLASELNSIIGNLDTNGNADSHDQANHDQAVKQTDSSLGKFVCQKPFNDDQGRSESMHTLCKERELPVYAVLKEDVSLVRSPTKESKSVVPSDTCDETESQHGDEESLQTSSTRENIPYDWDKIFLYLATEVVSMDFCIFFSVLLVNSGCKNVKNKIESRIADKHSTVEKIRALFYFWQEGAGSNIDPKHITTAFKELDWYEKIEQFEKYMSNPPIIDASKQWTEPSSVQYSRKEHPEIHNHNIIFQANQFISSENRRSRPCRSRGYLNRIMKFQQCKRAKRKAIDKKLHQSCITSPNIIEIPSEGNNSSFPKLTSNSALESGYGSSMVDSHEKHVGQSESVTTPSPGDFYETGPRISKISSEENNVASINLTSNSALESGYDSSMVDSHEKHVGQTDVRDNPEVNLSNIDCVESFEPANRDSSKENNTASINLTSNSALESGYDSSMVGSHEKHLGQTDVRDNPEVNLSNIDCVESFEPANRDSSKENNTASINLTSNSALESGYDSSMVDNHEKHVGQTDVRDNPEVNLKQISAVETRKRQMPHENDHETEIPCKIKKTCDCHNVVRQTTNCESCMTSKMKRNERKQIFAKRKIKTVTSRLVYFILEHFKDKKQVNEDDYGILIKDLLQRFIGPTRDDVISLSITSFNAASSFTMPSGESLRILTGKKHLHALREEEWSSLKTYVDYVRPVLVEKVNNACKADNLFLSYKGEPLK